MQFLYRFLMRVARKSLYRGVECSISGGHTVCIRRWNGLYHTLIKALSDSRQEHIRRRFCVSDWCTERWLISSKLAYMPAKNFFWLSTALSWSWRCIFIHTPKHFAYLFIQSRLFRHNDRIYIFWQRQGMVAQYKKCRFLFCIAGRLHYLCIIYMPRHHLTVFTY